MTWLFLFRVGRKAGEGEPQYAAAARVECVRLDVNVSVMAHLSGLDKGRLILLFDQGHSVKQAAEILGVALTTARRWKHRYEQEGERGLKARYDKCGRKRKTTEEEDRRMVEVRTFLLLFVAVVSAFLGQDERVVSDD